MTTTESAAFRTRPRDKSSTLRLKCLTCGAALDVGDKEVVCRACDQSWPIRDGVIRVFSPDYYWGEVSQSDATAFLREAGREGWRTAVTRRFGNDSDLLLSVLDTQRTTWISLLGLPSDAVALDIGSGFGALTHALSSQVAEVYSVEAMSERVGFTRIRLEQEGVSNVHLLQASALELPVLDASFDLIVVNGVLEWVGEWTRGENPREIQLRFLSQLRRLLKPRGVLVIGIENRIGWAALAGAMDHSGMSYTSLMPRWLASLCLRYNRRAHYRTTLNPKREYRTYTYSEFGARKLLTDSGFQSSWFYWADPGYNQPYELIPLRESFVRNRARAILNDSADGPRGGWRQKLKRFVAATHSSRLFVSDFVIIAQEERGASGAPGERIQTALQSALPQIPRLDRPFCSLFTWPFNTKNLVRVFENGAGAPAFVFKTSTPAKGSKHAVSAEFKNLSVVHARLEAGGIANLTVPRPIGSCQLGRLEYAVESNAAGQPLRTLLPDRRRGRNELPWRELGHGVEAAIQLTQLLRGEQAAEPVDPKWWTLPHEFEFSSAGDRELQDALFSETAVQDYADWVQHGDLSIENIFLEPATGRITVIDWEDMLRGVPPLYDCFALVFSVVEALTPSRESASQRVVDEPFLEAFFGEDRWAEFVRDLLALACDRLKIDLQRVWPMLVQCLTVRTQYYRWRGSPVAELCGRWLTLAWRHRDEFVLRAPEVLTPESRALSHGE